MRARRVQARTAHVVMFEAKFRRTRRQVSLAPRDHSAMQVNTEIALRARLLLNELARYAAASATEVENTLVRRPRQIRINRGPAGVVKALGIADADELAHPHGRNRQSAPAPPAHCSSRSR